MVSKSKSILVQRLSCATLAIACVTFWLGTATQASAGVITPNQLPTITIAMDGVVPPVPWSFTPAPDSIIPAPGQRGYALNAPRQFPSILGNRAGVEVQRLEFDHNPFVVNNILITNTTAATQTFTIGVTLPTTFPAPNVISGVVLAGVIDGNGAAGATVGTAGPGQPIYSAQVDFATVATLLDHPFTLTAPAEGIDSTMDSFGPSASLVPVISNIGIQLRFSLSAGDTATFLSRFDVIPEPASLGLVGLGAMALLRRRSR